MPVTSEQKISHYANRTPQIEINSVGAGGGSIAWLDAGDILMVGPQSAGAAPGPACYGRGGNGRHRHRRQPRPQPAVGRASPLASGQIPLDRDLALEALDDLGRRVGLDRRTPGRRHRAHRGRPHGLGHQADLDRQWPRSPRFRAAALWRRRADARGCHRRRAGDQPHPGADRTGQLCGVRLRSSPTSGSTIRAPAPCNSTSAAARADCGNVLQHGSRRHATIYAPKACADAHIEIGRALGMRYLGQSWELVVVFPAVPDDAALHGADDIASVERIIEAFADVHDRRFGHRSGGAVEIVSFRLAAVGRVAKPSAAAPQRQRRLVGSRIAVRDVYFGDGFIECSVYARDRPRARRDGRRPGGDRGKRLDDHRSARLDGSRDRLMAS